MNTAGPIVDRGVNQRDLKKVVSERLGHATVAFTLDTYTHAVEGMDRDAAIKIGATLQTALAKADKGQG
jgi:integrase